MKLDRQRKRRRAFEVTTMFVLQAILLAPGVVAAAESGRDGAAEPASDKSSKTGAAKAESPDTLNPDKINKILATEDVYGEQFKVSSFIQGNEVTVQTWTNPRSKDPEHDYKINAVLIAKKLMDAFPDAIRVCKVRYFDRQDFKKYTEFTIVPGIVKSFAAGIMSEADLLTTIPMVYFAGEAQTASVAGNATATGSSPATGNAATTGNSDTQAAAAGSTQASKAISGVTNVASLPPVQPGTAAAVNPASSQIPVAKPGPIDPNSIVTVLPGAQVNERAALLTRLKALEGKGTRSPELRKMFAVMEGLIRDGKEQEAGTLMASIAKSIGDLENNLKRAQAVKHSAGGPITVRTGSPMASGSGGSGARSAGGAPSSGGNDFEVGLGIIKRKMGDFYPHYGPLYIDRYNIGNSLFMMQSSGKNVEAYRQPFLQMEAMVISGGAGLEQSIKKLNEQLHLQEAVRDEEYQFQQKLADERKGMDLK